MGRFYAYCIDGTNLVRGFSGYGGPQFREQEQADCAWLAASLGQLCARLEGRVEVELFFDGPDMPWARAAGASNLRVRFGRETQADELIIDRVRVGGMGSGARVTVVTGDGELGRQACEEGGRWQKVRHGERLEIVLSMIENRINR